ncbi:MAG: flagellar motor switch protein FliG, partial [Phycisphaeraceae bacterium]
MAKKLDKLEELTGLERAAVLLLALDQSTAGLMLQQMDPTAVEDVTRELATISSVSAVVREGVMREFYDMVLAQQWVSEGGLEYATQLLKNSMDPATADKIIQQVSQSVQQTPFAFLQKAESDHLLTFIQDEHPQTIALIVSHLPYHKAAEILAGLASQKQIEVIKRVANMEQTNPEVIREVEKGLEARLSSLLTQRMEKTGGVETVAEMLNLVDRATEKGILEGLETDDPDLVESIRRLMFVFEDILQVNDKGIQAVLKEVDNDELALALKTASEELKTKIFKNMS